MKLEKAIEILSDSANRGVTTFNEDFKDAQNLGAEALKRIRLQRQSFVSSEILRLPGETKE